jgi:hypothetical protein
MVFDQIKKKQLLLAPETINTDWNSPSVSLDDRISAFSISVLYENGVGADLKVYVQLSNDDENFATIEESLALIVDSSGVVLFDLNGSGAQYARIFIEVTAGSIDVIEIKYVAVQAH